MYKSRLTKFAQYGAAVAILATVASVNAGTYGDSPPDDGLLACVDVFELPRSTTGLPRDWLPEGESGSVTIRFGVGVDESLRDVDIRGGTPELRAFSKKWLSASRFQAKCQGKRFSVNYVYKIHDLPVALHLPSVTVAAGNAFVLAFPARQRSAPLTAIPPNEPE